MASFDRAVFSIVQFFAPAGKSSQLTALSPFTTTQARSNDVYDMHVYITFGERQRPVWCNQAERRGRAPCFIFGGLARFGVTA